MVVCDLCPVQRNTIQCNSKSNTSSRSGTGLCQPAHLRSGHVLPSRADANREGRRSPDVLLSGSGRGLASKSDSEPPRSTTSGCEDRPVRRSVGRLLSRPLSRPALPTDPCSATRKAQVNVRRHGQVLLSRPDAAFAAHTHNG